MASQRLNALDASWLLVESRDTPMHVAGLMPFSLPEGAPDDFLTRLMAELRECTRVAPPWSYRLRLPGVRNLLPAWVEGPVDLEYHVRHSALPRPGGERELGQLVARLHSQPLDLSRPPWEFHLIEGLSGRRFAVYAKMHHSLIDGISGIRLLMRSMSEDPRASLALAPFWSPARGRRAVRPAAVPSSSSALEALREGLGRQARSVPQLARALSRLVGAAREGDAMQVPFGAPRAVLNGRASGQRRVATQRFETARLERIAKAAQCTLNDVVLALCGGALRAFLLEEGTLPSRALTAGVPVSVRPADDDGTGNAISFLLATLATDVADPRARLHAVVDSTRKAKAHLKTLPRDAMTQYTLLLMAPTTLAMLTPLAGRMRPMFNVTVSNVPGPSRPLYFRGARLEAVYPISLISHGMALNVTCVSYAGTLAFAFVGCRDTVPHLQRLAVCLAEAADELEGAVLGAAPGARASKASKASKAARRRSAGVRARSSASD